VSGGLSDRAALRKLDRAAGVLVQSMAGELARAAGDAEEKVRAAILSAPSHHDGELRRAVADSVTLEREDRADGAKFVLASDDKLMPRSRRRLNKRFNDPSFRHPVWGNDWWVAQVGAPGWFDGTLRRERDRFLAAIRRGMDAAARRST
jgi:hypothetical protein